jgi:transaldolase/glucose-6-phosphate isomerase
MNPLIELQKMGQSPWYDYIRRDLIDSGELTALIEKDGLMGMTSNPSIFEKAIGGSTEYDAAFAALPKKPMGVKAVYETLAIRDIQDAADLLFPVYKKTDGRDGYVSLEVSPHLAYDTQGTIEEALRLFQTVQRPNVMIKVPGTPEGVPAIERLIDEGLNINVTLLFGVERYRAVALAYIAGLQRRAARGLDIRRIASVASFFVSRIDTLIDAKLTARLSKTTHSVEQEHLRSLFGKVAIANAKVAYHTFLEIRQLPSFLALLEAGAMPQRLLWASTSTKNPAYKDTYYVEELIGTETVNTLPVATFNAFRDHGVVKDASLTTGLSEARETLALLADCGVNLSDATHCLLAEGVTLFSDSFDQLMTTIYKKRNTDCLSGSSWRKAIRPTLEALKQTKVVSRIWKKDQTVWLNDSAPLPLGWLGCIEKEMEGVSSIISFAKSIQTEFKSIVLLGMGGSSLCVKTLSAILGSAPGFPKLYLLDTILPDTVRRLKKQISLPETVFIVSSKSGTTIESITLCNYFLHELAGMKGSTGFSAGNHFIAITDPESGLMQYAKQNQFRHVFASTPDIGGRYSALSPSGIVPAALVGIDIQSLLAGGQTMQFACDADAPPDQNPALLLGAAMGHFARAGRDKLTFITPPTLRSLELWLEQLIAESTGKSGRGIVPIVHETLSSPHLYRDDRLFVYIRYSKEVDLHSEEQISALERAGHPVITVTLNSLDQIGEQFFLWEMATAVAGSVLNVNPFDQPDVEASKKNTRALLEKNKAIRMTQIPVATDDGITLFTNQQTEGEPTLKGVLASVLNKTISGDYLALNVYLEQTVAHDDTFMRIRNTVQRKKKMAVAMGYGPSYLHSTGQMQKGGPHSVLVFIVTADPVGDLAIPDQNYSLGQLALAQAIGDFEALCRLQRRVLRIHLGADAYRGLHKLIEGFYLL